MSCAKKAEPIDLQFGLWTRVGQRKHKFNRMSQVMPMCPHGMAHWHNLANTIVIIMTVRYTKYTIYNKSSEVAEMGDCLATIGMGRKQGAAVPLSMGELGPHLTQCGLDPSNCLTTIHQHHRKTDKTRQDKQWSDSIRQTVLHTVAQKLQ